MVVARQKVFVVRGEREQEQEQEPDWASGRLG